MGSSLVTFLISGYQNSERPINIIRKATVQVIGLIGLLEQINKECGKI